MLYFCIDFNHLTYEENSSFDRCRHVGREWSEDLPRCRRTMGELSRTEGGHSRRMGGRPHISNQLLQHAPQEMLEREAQRRHKLVAKLEEQYDVTVVTQNVDNLHEQAGSSKVIHLHGELMKVCSSRDVDDPRYQITLTPDNCEVEPGTKAGDGSLLRPFIVFFGEAVPNITIAAEETAQADILIIIGTSLNVYPAAGLMHYAKPDTPIYLIDPNHINAGERVKQIQKGASEGMKELVKILGID